MRWSPAASIVPPRGRARATQDLAVVERLDCTPIAAMAAVTVSTRSLSFARVRRSGHAGLAVRKGTQERTTSGSSSTSRGTSSAPTHVGTQQQHQLSRAGDAKPERLPLMKSCPG